MSNNENANSKPKFSTWFGSQKSGSILFFFSKKNMQPETLAALIGDDFIRSFFSERSTKKWSPSSWAWKYYFLLRRDGTVSVSETWLGNLCRKSESGSWIEWKGYLGEAALRLCLKKKAATRLLLRAFSGPWLSVTTQVDAPSFPKKKMKIQLIFQLSQMSVTIKVTEATWISWQSRVMASEPSQVMNQRKMKIRRFRTEIATISWVMGSRKKVNLKINPVFITSFLQWTSMETIFNTAKIRIKQTSTYTTIKTRISCFRSRRMSPNLKKWG